MLYKNLLVKSRVNSSKKGPIKAGKLKMEKEASNQSKKAHRRIASEVTTNAITPNRSELHSPHGGTMKADLNGTWYSKGTWLKDQTQSHNVSVTNYVQRKEYKKENKLANVSFQKQGNMLKKNQYLFDDPELIKQHKLKEKQAQNSKLEKVEINLDEFTEEKPFNKYLDEPIELYDLLKYKKHRFREQKVLEKIEYLGLQPPDRYIIKNDKYYQGGRVDKKSNKKISINPKDSFASDITSYDETLEKPGSVSSVAVTSEKMDSLIMSCYDSEKNAFWDQFENSLKPPIPSEASAEQFNLYSKHSDDSDEEDYDLLRSPASNRGIGNHFSKRILLEETVDKFNRQILNGVPIVHIKNKDLNETIQEAADLMEGTTHSVSEIEKIFNHFSQELGTPPIKFLQHFIDEKLYLKGYNLSHDICKTIALTLPYMQQTTEVSFVSNGLSDHSCSLLLYSIFQISKIKTIRICKNEIGEQFAQTLDSMIKKYPNKIECLDLQANKGFMKISSKILESIKGNERLKDINFSSNQFSINAMTHLCQIIKGNESLNSISISQCGIRQQSSRMILLSLLDNKNLSNVDISWNSMSSKTSEFGSIIGNIIRSHSRLLHFNISSCQLIKEECIFIAQCLKESKRIVALHMGGNAIDHYSRLYIRSYLEAQVHQPQIGQQHMQGLMKAFNKVEAIKQFQHLANNLPRFHEFLRLDSQYNNQDQIYSGYHKVTLGTESGFVPAPEYLKSGQISLSKVNKGGSRAGSKVGSPTRYQMAGFQSSIQVQSREFSFKPDGSSSQYRNQSHPPRIGITGIDSTIQNSAGMISLQEGHINPHCYQDARRMGRFNVFNDFNFYGIKQQHKRNSSHLLQASVDSQEEKVDILHEMTQKQIKLPLERKATERFDTQVSQLKRERQMQKLSGSLMRNPSKITEFMDEVIQKMNQVFETAEGGNPMQGHKNNIILMRFVDDYFMTDGQRWMDSSQCWICEKWDRMTVQFAAEQDELVQEGGVLQMYDDGSIQYYDDDTTTPLNNATSIGFIQGEKGTTTLGLDKKSQLPDIAKATFDSQYLRDKEKHMQRKDFTQTIKMQNHMKIDYNKAEETHKIDKEETDKQFEKKKLELSPRTAPPQTATISAASKVISDGIGERSQDEESKDVDLEKDDLQKIEAFHPQICPSKFNAAQAAYEMLPKNFKHARHLSGEAFKSKVTELPSIHGSRRSSLTKEELAAEIEIEFSPKAASRLKGRHDVTSNSSLLESISTEKDVPPRQTMFEAITAKNTAMFKPKPQVVKRKEVDMYINSSFLKWMPEKMERKGQNLYQYSTFVPPGYYTMYFMKDVPAGAVIGKKEETLSPSAASDRHRSITQQIPATYFCLSNVFDLHNFSDTPLMFNQVSISQRQWEVSRIGHQKEDNFDYGMKTFNKNQSVFRDWIKLSDQDLLKMFQIDMSLCKIQRIFKNNPQEYEIMYDLIYSFYPKLILIYLHCICNSGYPTISWNDFTSFCYKCHIVDKTINLSTLDRLFITTNVSLYGNTTSGERDLQRYEFIEILVRISIAKYFENPPKSKDRLEALNKLIHDNIFEYSEIPSYDDFREETIYTIEVNNIIFRNESGLKKIFDIYLHPQKKYWTTKDVLDLINYKLDLKILDKQIVMCFGCSKSFPVDLSKNLLGYNKLSYPEYLEFICRISHEVFKNDDRCKDKKLHFKIDWMIFKLFKIKNIPQMFTHMSIPGIID